MNTCKPCASAFSAHALPRKEGSGDSPHMPCTADYIREFFLYLHQAPQTPSNSPDDTHPAEVTISDRTYPIEATEIRLKRSDHAASSQDATEDNGGHGGNQ